LPFHATSISVDAIQRQPNRRKLCMIGNRNPVQ
jgi:hypothetical protein